MKYSITAINDGKLMVDLVSENKSGAKLSWSTCDIHKGGVGRTVPVFSYCDDTVLLRMIYAALVERMRFGLNILFPKGDA